MRSSFSVALLLCIAVPAIAAETPIGRQQLNDWEPEIGYVAITRVDNTLYLSGIACSGDGMQAAVTSCYQRIATILGKYSVGTDRIVKENVYTTDIEALKKSIPDRKTFFKEARYPAATWVEVRRLFDPSHLLEVEVIVQL
ncbi:MAG TPA: RidA family protein [Povalibacter sp.]